MAKNRLIVMAGCLVLLAGLAAAVSAPSVVAGAHPHPEEIEQKKNQLEEVVGRARDCSYRLRIKTSCRSPRLTRDAIAISFGDAYNNQVYAAHLDDPWTKTFERCSTDTFDIYGPCGYGVCYLYLWRDGSDGWIPDWVDVYDPYYAHFITFTYGSPIPPRLWYGFNLCTRQSSSSTAQPSA